MRCVNTNTETYTEAKVNLLSAAYPSSLLLCGTVCKCVINLLTYFDSTLGWKTERKKQSEMTELSCPLSSALTRAIMVGRPAGGSTHVSSEKGGVRFGKGQRLGNSHTKQERRREDERA